MRYENWPLRLSQILIEKQDVAFMWGTHDCCLFAADVVLELTGVDLAADVRGTYDSAVTASRILADRGGVRGVTAIALGAEIPPLMAQRGDIVLLDMPEHGHTLAVCTGTHCAAPGVDELRFIPMAEAVAAWRVA